MALVIAVQVWAGIGVAVVIYLAGLQAIPGELYEVASIDGATSGSSCATSPFPLLAPAVTANTLLSIIGALQSYQLIYVLTGPINPATQVLSLAIFTQGFGGAQGGAVQSQGYAAAISMVQFVIVMIVSRGHPASTCAGRRRHCERPRRPPSRPPRPRPRRTGRTAPATAHRSVSAKVVQLRPARSWSS